MQRHGGTDRRRVGQGLEAGLRSGPRCRHHRRGPAGGALRDRRLRLRDRLREADGTPAGRGAAGGDPGRGGGGQRKAERACRGRSQPARIRGKHRDARRALGAGMRRLATSNREGRDMRYKNRQGWEGNSEDEAFERGRGWRGGPGEERYGYGGRGFKRPSGRHEMEGPEYYGQGHSGQRESGFGYGRQQGFQGGQGGGYGTGGMSGWSGPEGSFQEGESWGGTGGYGTGSQTHSGIRQ